MRYKATIDIYIEMGDRWSADTEGALADGISAMMQDVEERTAAHGAEFVLIVWSYQQVGRSEWAHARPFTGKTPEELLQADLEGGE
jgi:hypothetical protein